MPVNDFGTVTNLTNKLISTAAHEDGVDGNEFDEGGSFRYDLHPGQAVPIMTRLDQAWFLDFPERFEVAIKGKVISKKTVESTRAAAQAEGEKLIKQAKTAKA